jgi:hypothetical protein
VAVEFYECVYDWVWMHWVVVESGMDFVLLRSRLGSWNDCVWFGFIWSRVLYRLGPLR